MKNNVNRSVDRPATLASVDSECFELIIGNMQILDPNRRSTNLPTGIQIRCKPMQLSLEIPLLRASQNAASYAHKPLRDVVATK